MDASGMSFPSASFARGTSLGCFNDDMLANYEMQFSSANNCSAVV